MTAGLTLDAGALIAFERNDRRVVALLARALHHQLALVVPAGVIGQVWRDETFDEPASAVRVTWTSMLMAKQTLFADGRTLLQAKRKSSKRFG